MQRLVHLGIFVCAVACVPNVDVELWRVDEPRLLAIRTEPAEAAPGDLIDVTALYAGADGTIDAPEIDWAFCTARRPLAELGPVAPSCLEEEDRSLVRLGRGESVSGRVPVDTCRLFGPDPPPSEPGQPSGRPVDPDITGGYFQPLIARSEDAELSLFRMRIACGLAKATQRQAAEYRRRYQRNAAPRVDSVAHMVEGSANELNLDAPLVVRVGERVDLRVRWPACSPESVCGDGFCTLDETAETCAGDCEGQARGCGGAETYLLFEPSALELVLRRESISLAWFTNDGAFEVARTGRAPDELEAWSDNVWVAPDEPGTATLWIVVRDDRGGASWTQIEAEVFR